MALTQMKAVRTMFSDIKRLEHLCVPAKYPLKRPQVFHIDCTLGFVRVSLAISVFFWGGLEWLKINYVTLSVVNKRRIYNIYIAQVITTRQQGESFFICLEKILSFLFYLNVSQCFFGSSYYRLHVQNRCVN